MEDKDVLYAKWLNGEISDDELVSTAGTEALADLQRIVRTSDQLMMPKYDTTSGYKRFKQNNKKKQTKVRKINWLKLSGIAASFLILFFFGNRFLTNNNENIYANNGQNENRILADGSQVWLNDGSTISYDSKNWEEERVIELSGEAKFEVTKGKPFIVNTKNGAIRVLGTQFNVRAWGSNLYVECYEGKVQVTDNNQEIILTAKEAVNVVQGKMNKKVVISNMAPLWQNSMSRFYDEKLIDVFKELERQYDIKVNITATNRTFSGNFQHDDLGSALKSICMPMDLNYKINEDLKTVDVE